MIGMAMLRPVAASAMKRAADALPARKQFGRRQPLHREPSHLPHPAPARRIDSMPRQSGIPPLRFADGKAGPGSLR
jgi:hypothetical protein